MSPYLWKMRPLIIFAPSSSAPALVRQMRTVTANRQGFAERDMAVVTVAGDTVAVPLGPRPDLAAEAMRRRHGVARDAFRVLLIGKDGGVKLSSNQAVDAARLFALIDSMPMRRQEMREKGR